MIYEEFKKKIINELNEERINIISREYYNRTDPLFEIATEDDKVYSTILSAFNYVAIKNVENLCASLLKKYNIWYEYNINEPSSYDLMCEIDGEKTYVEFKTSHRTLDRGRLASKAGIIKNIKSPVLFVLLQKNSVVGQRGKLKLLDEINSADIGDKVDCLLFEEFIEKMFGQDEANEFHKVMLNFRKDLHKTIGYQLTEICNDENMEKFKKEIETTIKTFPYESIKNDRNRNMNNNQISDASFRKIKDNYINNEKYQILLENKDFAESFITSEWLYSKYIDSTNLDSTYKVAGYLKSIEQLLWDIIIVVGEGKTIKKKNEKNVFVSVNSENENIIDKTLGSLESFIGYYGNSDLFMNYFGNEKRNVMSFIKQQISDWRSRYRNGYFHKHNLAVDKINDIREETYFIYMLILGSLELTEETLSVLCG